MLIDFEQFKMWQAMRDGAACRPLKSIVEHAKEVWSEAEAKVKAKAHATGQLVRWQMNTRADHGIDFEIDTLRQALKRAEMAKETAK